MIEIDRNHVLSDRRLFADRHLRVFAQQIDVIVWDDLQQIDFSLLQGCNPRRLIRNAQQLDAVEVHDFSAGETIWWLGTGNIVWVAGKDRLGARRHSSFRKMKGPEPTISGTAVFASRRASRAGIITGI